MYAYHDSDLPQVRYATDWALDTAIRHRVNVDKLRWSADPLSLYLFKNLTGATTVTIEVEHDDGDWRRSTTTTTITVSTISAAMTAAGYTLADTDILVLGHVTNGAFIMRDGSPLLYVADLISRDDGDYFGQIYRGNNIIKVRGATFAQHHVFRRILMATIPSNFTDLVPAGDGADAFQRDKAALERFTGYAGRRRIGRACGSDGPE